MKVAVIGANGQVGREVCLFLKALGAVPIPISRAALGGIFLERCGIECRYGSVGDEHDAVKLLEGCDIVVDFAHPIGLSSKVQSAVRSNITNIVKYAPPGVPYIFISTISAFGMPNDSAKMKNYFFSRTMYSADKRRLESFALKQKRNRDVYVLRLGQVHGELQTVSEEFKEEVKVDDLRLPFPEDTKSYSVFCYSIAEAVMNIYQKKETPGKYTLISSPAWNWSELYQYWADRGDENLKLTFEDIERRRPSKLLFIVKLIKKVLEPLIKIVIQNRQLILNYGSFGSLRVQEWLQATFMKRRAVSEINALDVHRISRNFNMGKTPGRRLVSLSDSRIEMEYTAAIVREIIKASSPSLEEVKQKSI